MGTTPDNFVIFTIFGNIRRNSMLYASPVKMKNPTSIKEMGS
jgi:hypothetical protein